MFGGAGFGAEWFAGQAEGLVLETAPAVVIPGAKFGPGALPPPIPDVIRLPTYGLAGPGLDRRPRLPSRAGIVRIGQGQLWLTSGAVLVSTPVVAPVPLQIIAVRLSLSAGVQLRLASAAVRVETVQDLEDEEWLTLIAAGFFDESA